MNFTSRVEIARHGFESVTHASSPTTTTATSEICERHGIEISAKRVRKVVEHFDAENGADARLAQDPRADHRRAAAPVRLRLSGRQAALRVGATARLSMRRAAGGRSPARLADARCARGRARRARRRGARARRDAPGARPARRRRAAGRAARRSWPGCRPTSKPRSRSAVDQARALLADRLRRGARPAREQRAQRLQRAGLARPPRRPGRARAASSSSSRAGAADRVADAQAGQAPGLGEAAEDEQARVVARAARASVGAAGRRRTRRAPRRAARRRRSGRPVEQPLAARRSESSSPVGSLGLQSAIDARALGRRRSSSASTPSGHRHGAAAARGGPSAGRAGRRATA